MSERTYDAVVIGAGPGGYVAAIRLAQLGRKTLCIEQDRIGGVCLNYGCIPSKALISAADRFSRLDQAAEMGIRVTDKTLDFGVTQAWKQKVVDRLTGGVEKLLKGNGVEVMMGTASFTGPNTLEVKGEGEAEKITFANGVIATGSSPFFLEGFEPDGEVVVDSRQALAFESIPERLLVIGGGYIGLELGMAYARFGTRVTVIEMMDTLLGGTPKELSAVVARTCKKLGVKIHLKTAARSLERGKGRAVLTAEDPDGEKQTFEAERVLVTIGRKPDTRGLNLEQAGLETNDRGFVEVDAQRRTKVPHLYAIGDVAGEPLLAHKASKEGIVAAEAIAGEPVAYDYRAVPAVIFTDPEIAYVGLDEEQAQAQGYEVAVGKFPFAASGRALAMAHTDGFVKVIGDRKSGALLGVQIVGAEASDLISEACLALEMGARMEDIGYTMHPHPTLGEAIMEAAEAALGRAVHQLNK
jgi:dihydrolipoamide dehydrogenase